MICIIAESYRAAERWANGQMLRRDEWFYPASEEDLYSRSNFHVVVDTSSEIPNGYLNRILTVAWKQGRKRNGQPK